MVIWKQVGEAVQYVRFQACVIQAWKKALHLSLYASNLDQAVVCNCDIWYQLLKETGKKTNDLFSKLTTGGFILPKSCVSLFNFANLCEFCGKETSQSFQLSSFVHLMFEYSFVWLERFGNIWVDLGVFDIKWYLWFLIPSWTFTVLTNLANYLSSV